MLTNANPDDLPKIDDILPSFIDINGSIIITPDAENLKKEFEEFRVQKIYEQLPEYCIQFLFLS
jgi:hypothetical protein